MWFRRSGGAGDDARGVVALRFPPGCAALGATPRTAVQSSKRTRRRLSPVCGRLPLTAEGAPAEVLSAKPEAVL